MRTHPDPVCIVLWLNETSVFFYLLALRKELLVPQAQKYNCTPFLVYSGL